MGRIARARVKVRSLKDAKQDKKLRKLELTTNKALRNAKRNEEINEAQDKANKAKEREATAKRQKNAARSKRNEKAIKSFKKMGRQFLKKFK